MEKTLINIGPVISREMALLGYKTRSDLQRDGLLKIFNRWVYFFPERLHGMALQALQGALVGVPLAQLSARQKEEANSLLLQTKKYGATLPPAEATKLIKYQTEVETFFQKTAPEGTPEQAARYQGGGLSRFEFKGHKVPQIRSFLAQNYSINHLDTKSAALAWSHLWQQTNQFEAASAAVYFALQDKIMYDPLDYWPLFKQWADHVDNWPHSDGLSKYYSLCLERDSEIVLPELKKWNTSKNPWLQRLSLTSLLCYSTLRKEVLPFPALISFINRLLPSENMYVQKAIGWTLRELGNVYPTQTSEFLEANIGKLSSLAFSAATEKISPEFKLRLKEMRGILR